MKHLFSLPWACRLAAVAWLLLTGSFTRAQAPAWQTAMGFLGTCTYTTVVATAADATGNVYVLGEFDRNLTLGNTTLACVGQADVFVAKWSPASNNFLWAHQLGGAYREYATGIAVSGSNVYLSGHFNSYTLQVGNSITLVNAGQGSRPTSELFVAKLVDAGNSASFAWAERVGSQGGADIGGEIAVNGASVYLMGQLGPNTTFGSTPLPLPSNSGYVIKATDLGPRCEVSWWQRAGYGGTVAAVGTNVYIAGSYLGTESFGATTLTNSGSGFGGYIAKLVDAGASSRYVWARERISRPPMAPVCALIQGRDTVIYTVGSFTGTVTQGGQTLSSAGAADILVEKLADTGTSVSAVWVQRAGGASSDVVRAVTVRGSEVFIAGEYQSPTADFGNTTLTNSGVSNAFVAKLIDGGNTGNYAWAQQAGGTAEDKVNALSLNGTTLFVAGDYGENSPSIGSSFANFGSLMLTYAVPSGATYLLGAGFLASLAAPTITATASGKTAESMGLFPNPAHGRATVQLPAGAGPATLTVLDALGRPVHTQTTTGSQAELDLSGLTPGLYAVRVQAGGTAATQRLVVK
jgi:hypothetical protein